MTLISRRRKPEIILTMKYDALINFLSNHTFYHSILIFLVNYVTEFFIKCATQLLKFY